VRIGGVFVNRLSKAKHAQVVAALVAGQHFMHYEFRRVHKTLRVIPAIEAGISNHVGTLDEFVNLWGVPGMVTE